MACWNAAEPRRNACTGDSNDALLVLACSWFSNVTFNVDFDRWARGLDRVIISVLIVLTITLEMLESEAKVCVEMIGTNHDRRIYSFLYTTRRL